MKLTKEYVRQHNLTVHRGYIDGFVKGSYVLYQILSEHADHYIVMRRD